MPISNAIYKDGTNEVVVNVEEVHEKSNYNNVVKNLYCTFSGCEARLKYVPKGKRVAHFTTWPKVDHTEECIDFFLREEKKAGQRSENVTSIKLTDKHISDVLKRVSKHSNETEEEREARLARERLKRRKKKSLLIDRKQEQKLVDRISPTTSNDADVTGQGTRAPSIRTRSTLNSLNDSDIGKATCISSKLTKIIFDDERVVFELAEYQSTLKVYLEEAFFANSVTNIRSFLENIKLELENKKSLKIILICDVEARQGEICASVAAQNCIYINDKPLASFAWSITNPKLF